MRRTKSDHLMSARRPNLEIVNKKKKKKKKKRMSRIVDFVVPADHRVELKENLSIEQRILVLSTLVSPSQSPDEGLLKPKRFNIDYHSK